MSQPFGRTAASLAGDRSRESLISLAIAVLVLAAWLIWLVFARVPLYEVPLAARLEAGQAPHPLQAPIDGRLAETFLDTGREVRAGELLAQIAADPELASRREAEARASSLERELLARQAELDSAIRAAGEQRTAAAAALDTARAQLAEAEATAPFLKGEAGRLGQLSSEGLVAPRDAQRGASEAARQDAAAGSARALVEQLQRESAVEEREREAGRRRLEADIARLAGEAEAAREALGRSSFEVERRSLRSPIDGVVAESGGLKPGAFVEAGDVLAVLLPAGELILVAQLSPAALGRVEPGQPAQLELQGFPAAQYGRLAARVERVAGELRDGSLRAELSLEAPEAARAPLRHGMPATVEIEVERLSPLELGLRLLRSAFSAPRAGRDGNPR
jgi:multidrug resistance efflux pump